MHSRREASYFVPDGTEAREALARATHLGIVAHPDDLEIAAFEGIVRAHQDPACRFAGIVVTHGAKSPRPDALSQSDEAMRARRRAEQHEAARAGGYAAVCMLDYDSEQVRGGGRTGLIEELGELLSVVRPRVVYTHSLADRHETHVAVASATVEALRRSGHRPERLLGCEVWGDLDWLASEDRIVLDVSGWEELGRRLLGLFASQIDAGKRYDLATLGRRRAHATFEQSHAIDATQEVILAMDLGPLLDDPSLAPADLVDAMLARMRREVMERLRRMGDPHDRS